jgi:DNA replication initiation complex subunit (GINS family)
MFKKYMKMKNQHIYDAEQEISQGLYDYTYHFKISVDDLVKDENEIKKSTKSSSRSPSRSFSRSPRSTSRSRSSSRSSSPKKSGSK